MSSGANTDTDKMHEQDRKLLKEISRRLDRIESAMLGDSEHNVWGYSQRLQHTEGKVSSLEKVVNDNYTEISNIKAAKRSYDILTAVIATLLGGVLGAFITLFFTGGT